MPSYQSLSHDQAQQIYNILVQYCGASEEGRETFVYCQMKEYCREYRFIGDLGFGGKFWNSNGEWYVTCYSEDETDNRKNMIKSANHQLILLCNKNRSIDRILALIGRAELILSGNYSWEEKYDQIFNLNIRKEIREAGYQFDWYDPDTTYEEDITAYMRALGEFKSSLSLPTKQD